MLAMADVSIDRFLPLFANTGVPVAFLVPTPTGYEKSIMDATAPVRKLLKDEDVHDYELQGQGPENKERIKSYFVHADDLEETTASLYRPVTKQGDPRIWFDGLRGYCHPCNLLALTVVDGEIYVFNLSDESVVSSIENYGAAYNALVSGVVPSPYTVADELVERLRAIHAMGFLRSITPGDPGVGDTLENALGIHRNPNKAPDYRGIELKSSRITRRGAARNTTRATLFAQVPDFGQSYHDILNNFGKWQIPRNQTEERFQIYETLYVSRPNAYDLQFKMVDNRDELHLVHNDQGHLSYVSSWKMETLRNRLLEKHHETFWIYAESVERDGVEYFRYNYALHTRNPNATLFSPLLENDKITADLAAHIKPDGKYKDHGFLFKMWPDDLPLLLGEAARYDL